jgi:HEAT repeat protein
VPELLGRGSPDRTAFAEVHTKKMVRFRHWKLIHDYRKSTFELYDLLTDPRERNNLIGHRRREASQLKSLLHGWFDRLRAVAGDGEENRPEGIDLGRIGDRRSVPMLTNLVTQPSSPSRWRVEAAQLLGLLQDRGAADALYAAVADDDQRVAEEAAIALGEIKDRKARLILPAVLSSTTTDVRLRAAIAAARVDSSAATPALIEALYSNKWEIQNRAAHYLGFVGDRRAIGPLLRMAQRPHLRSRIALALGRIGRRHRDKRIYPYLLDQVRKDPHAEVRQRALGGLGFLGDRRAIRPLAALLAVDPDLSWTPETLTRLGGIGWYSVPGLDFSPRRKGLREGWGHCEQSRSLSADVYLGSTWCGMSNTQSVVQFQLRRSPFHAQLLLRYRPLRSRLRGASLSLLVNGRALPPLAVSGGWRAERIDTRSKLWRHGTNIVQLRLTLPRGVSGAPAGDLIALDYLVLAVPAKQVGKRQDQATNNPVERQRKKRP